jgi:hypothetical protein
VPVVDVPRRRPSSLSVASFALATSVTVSAAVTAGAAMTRLAAPAARPPRVAPRVDAAGGGAVRESRRGGDVAAVDGDALRRRRLSDGAVGTYVSEILLERDSALSRWPARVSEPLRVWVQPWAPVTGWDDRFAARARDAFVDWQRTGIPVRFAFTDDSAAADLRVTWIDHFDEPISGKTLWTRDERWWITGASITLALHHQDGAPLDAGAVRAIALHEVGHLLGLDHTSDPGNVMTPRVRVRDLSAADRATVRLLYSLPPGRVR